MPPFMDITGQRFGLLTVVSRAPNDRQRLVRWECLCDCGNTTVQRGSSLRGGIVVSCGCVRTSKATARLVAATRKPDGAIGYTAAHGRVKRVRGLAEALMCVDCGGPATDWSLKKDARHARAATSGREAGLRYSHDPNDYDPRCRSCHGKYDGWGRSDIGANRWPER
jgi:hypothetical protein